MKTMKSTVARLFALCLTVAMVLSMATMGAFAATTINTVEQEGEIKVIGSVDDNKANVELYKIIDVNMVKVEENVVQPQNPMYTWVEAVGQWVEKNYADYVKVIKEENKENDKVVSSTYVVTEKFANEGAKELGDFYEALYNAIKGGTIVGLEAVDTVTIAKEKDAERYFATSTQPMGQYLVNATKNGNTYNPATATLYPVWGDNSWELNDATVVLKSKGSIEKNVDGTGDLDYSIGDSVTYRLDVPIPVYPKPGPNEEIVYKAFKIGDNMGKGLTFSGLKDGEGNDLVKVYANTSPNSYDKDNDLVPMGSGKNANYTISEAENGFEIQFNYDNLKATVDTDTYVHVVYTATLNEDAFKKDSLGNTAYVGVNTNPYDEDSVETETVTKKVYTYGFTVTKVGENDEPLPGAEFKLYSDAACTKGIKFVDKGNGVYTKSTEDDGIATALVTNENGQLQVQGLACGTYYLKETKAPDGYVLPANPIKVELVDNEPDGKLDGCSVEGGIIPNEVSPLIVGEPGEEIQTGDNIFEFIVKNEKPGFNLPTTGGMGTVLFTAGGLVIMACGAALVLVTLKKKKAED